MCLCHKVATWGIAYLIRTGACEALLCHVKPGSWLLNPSWMELPYVRVSLAARRSSASFWSSSELYCVSSGLSVGRSQPAERALWIIKKKTTQWHQRKNTVSHVAFLYSHDEHSLDLMLPTTFHQFKQEPFFLVGKMSTGMTANQAGPSVLAFGQQHGQHYSSDHAVAQTSNSSRLVQCWLVQSLSYSSSLWDGHPGNWG